MNRIQAINLFNWVYNEEGGADQIAASQPPSTTPGNPGNPMGQDMPMGSMEQPKSVSNQDTDQDVTHDPHAPDMPEEHPIQDFEVWRNHFLRESIKGNSNILIDLIHSVRDRDLDPSQRKFVEDNLQIQFLRQQANVMQASKELRKKINERLDKNNPSTSLVQHLYDVLSTQRMLADVFIKLNGYYGMKSDLHRKFLAALFGAVQMGVGGTDLITINDNAYSIMITTRMNADFGELAIGKWSLVVHDPEHFLSEPEQKRLVHGSPEEREALRHRVIIDSIAHRFKERSFLLTVTSDDGTIYNIGLDLSTCLRASYVAGKLVVRTHMSENSEVMMDDDGNIIPFLDIEIKYTKDTGEIGSDGKPKVKELPFIEKRDGMLFLVAGIDVLKETAADLHGLEVTGIPYQGNPSDLRVLTRCVWNASEMLMRQC